MKALLWVLRKELQLFLSDRTGALMTILMPVLLSGLVGMLFAPRDKDPAMPLLVVDEDGGPAVAQLVAALDAHDRLAVERVDLATARDRLAHGKAEVALHLPAGTSAALTPSAMVGGAGHVAYLLHDPSQAITAGFAGGLIVQSIMAQVGAAFGDPKAMIAMLEDVRAGVGGGLEGAAWRAFIDTGVGLMRRTEQAGAGGAAGPGGLKMPLTLESQEVTPADGRSEYNSYAHTFAGMLCMFLLFMAQGTGKNLVEERTGGTLTRLRAAGLRNWQILGGVGLSTAAIAAVISALLYLVGGLVFGVRVHGSWAGFVAVLAAQSLFVGGFALLLAGAFRTPKQIDSIGTFAILVMSFVGGAWLPSFLMPEWLGRIALALPVRWATDGLAAATWRGLGAAETFTAAAVLLGFAVACAAIGAWRFRAE